MNWGVSIVICCHNSAKRLPETLHHLASQQVPGKISWEVIVVDNASTDGTAETARRCWPDGGPASLRVVMEPEAGLSNARRCGIREAQFEIVSFIDDDNWVSADWVERIEAIFSTHSEVGGCGGKSEAAGETALPVWFEQRKGYYAVGSQHARNGDITDTRGTLLWGAGLSLRVAAVRDLFDKKFEFLLSGRRGAKLLAGEDTEICFALRALGWKFWYDDALTLRHFISKERLRWEYARQLMRGMGGASLLFDLYLIALNRYPFDTAPAWKKTWLFFMLKAMRRYISLLLMHPMACLLQREGAMAALDFQEVSGRLVGLWKIAGQFEEMKQRIERSMWILPRE